MKTKKWLKAMLIITGIFVLLTAALLTAAAVMSDMGYGMTVGKLYVDDGGAYYLIDEDNRAMLVSYRSNGGNLFEGCQSGDRILLIHDGVEETYPARTGGYFVFRLSKGDGSYKPEDEILGFVPLQGADVDLSIKEIEFEAKYIRTDGYHDGREYPVAEVVSSKEELDEYYDKYKDEYSLDRSGSLSGGEIGGFLDACAEYGEEFFEEKSLVMIILEEGSGSVRHEVKSVLHYAAHGYLTVNVKRLVPEAGTCDMAEWHIILSVDKEYVPAEADDVVVLIDGVNPKTQPRTVSEQVNYTSITLTLPYGWKYEIERMTDSYEYCIAFWPEGQSEGRIKLWFLESFGVCGTGLKEEEITLGEYSARKGTYDNGRYWEFITFDDLPGRYVVINDGANKWLGQYGDEVMAILATARLAENILPRSQAVALAEKEAGEDYELYSAAFDAENGIWTVKFSSKSGTDTLAFYITSEGKLFDRETVLSVQKGGFIIEKKLFPDSEAPHIAEIPHVSESEIIHPLWKERITVNE